MPSTDLPQRPTDTPPVTLPDVVWLRAPGHTNALHEELADYFAAEGWYVVRGDKNTAWHLQRGGHRVVVVDLVCALDDDPVVVGQVRARCGQPDLKTWPDGDDPDYEPQEMRLMTGGQRERTRFYDPAATNMLGQSGASRIDPRVLVRYVHEALDARWCKNSAAPLVRN